MMLIRSETVKLLTDFNFMPTFQAYTEAYNHTCKVGWTEKEFNGVRLHHLVYPTLRQTLPAQLCTSARMKATKSLHGSRTSLKNGKKTSCPKSTLCSIRLDSQSHSVWFDKNEVSILTTQGRVKGIKFQSYPYFDQFRTWKRKSADLTYRKGQVFLTFVFEKLIPDAEYQSNTFVGIDRGIRRIAVTSDKQFFGGGRIKHVCHRYQRLRSELQSCGTRSAKRHLRRVAQKENRFRKDVNHCVSKQIVQGLPVGSTIVIEQLKYIRERCRQRQEQRGEFHNWSFYQLEQFLTYKAEAKGCRVVYVDPRYTSQKCSCCGHTSKSNRKDQTRFKCIHCGYTLNADLNASFNIRNNYLDATCHPSRASVNRPVVSSRDLPVEAGDLVTSHGPCARGY